MYIFRKETDTSLAVLMVSRPDVKVRITTQLGWDVESMEWKNYVKGLSEVQRPEGCELIYPIARFYLTGTFGAMAKLRAGF